MCLGFPGAGDHGCSVVREADLLDRGALGVNGLATEPGADHHRSGAKQQRDEDGQSPFAADPIGLADSEDDGEDRKQRRGALQDSVEAQHVRLLVGEMLVGAHIREREDAAGGGGK